MSAETAAPSGRCWIIAQYPCPGCGSGPGVRCVSKTGSPTGIHVLRRNLAVRKAASSGQPCPGCSGDLRIVHSKVEHVGTGRFECDALPGGAR